LLIESITNPAGDETGYGYGETIHNNTPPHPFLLTSITPANGLSSEFEYDVFARLQRVHGPEAGVAPYNGPSIQYTYPLTLTWQAPMTVTTQTNPNDADSAVRATGEAIYDGLGRVLQRRQVGMPNEQGSGTVDLITFYGYDGLGRVICESLPVANGTGPCTSEEHTTYTYDVAGRLISTATPDGL